MIPGVRENSEVVIKFTQKYGIFMLIIMGLIWDEYRVYKSDIKSDDTPSRLLGGSSCKSQVANPGDRICPRFRGL